MRQKQTEETLIRLFGEDPDTAVEACFRAYYGEVLRQVFRMLPDREKAEDISQEIFLELWKKRNTLVVRSSVGALLRSMARTRTLNYIRDNKKRYGHSEDALPALSSSQSSIQDELIADELQREISKTIENLPARCREVFVLSRYEHLSYKEIAAALGISIKTVENQMIKALRALRLTITRHRNV